MFKSIVLSYFDYCSIVWGSCGEGMRNRLQTLQSRAARVVTSSSYDRRSAEILDELGWDNFQTRRTGQFATIMYKLKNHIAPDHVPQILACVASVSVLFPSKDRAKNHFSRGQNRESRSSVFLCSETARKRLLRRLLKFLIVQFLCTRIM